MIRKILLIICLAPLALGHALASQSILAARNIAAGDIIGPADLVASDTDTTVAEAYLGKEAKRSFYKGAAVTLASLRAPVLVKRNAIVEMTYRGQGLLIRTEGRALDEGASGELIRVMNLGSRTTVTAKVLESGAVEVGR